MDGQNVWKAALVEERSETSRSGTTLAARGWHSRGFLPHCDFPGLLQGITFRLHDAVPTAVIAEWKRDLHWIEKQEDAGCGVWEEQFKELRRRLALYEDAGRGACYLRKPEIARLMEDALRHFDGERYILIGWCIMPNHVHVFIRTREGWPIGHVVQSWKRHTARKANCILVREGPFWAVDYYDRFIRDEPHYWRALDYIHLNPVKAGLCATSTDWNWSSADEWDVRLNSPPVEGPMDRDKRGAA